MSDTQNQTLLKKLNQENKVLLPNLVLILSSFYFLVILCEDCPTWSRKLFYFGLLILDASILIYINRAIFSPVGGFLYWVNNLLERLSKGKEKVEETDTIKKFIE
jgi:hypothetical protein